MWHRIAAPSLVFMIACGSDKDSSPPSDAAVDDGGDGTTGDAAVDGPPPDAGTMGISCGTMTCTSSTMECCTTFSGNTPSYTCIPSGDTCNGSTASCDGPEDCAMNQRCCGGGGGGGGGGTSCAPTTGGCQVERCHSAADCSTQGDMCCTSQFIGNYCNDVCF